MVMVSPFARAENCGAGKTQRKWCRRNVAAACPQCREKRDAQRLERSARPARLAKDAGHKAVSGA
jgi:hypothetical protein